jgi:hypothetical protein
MAGRPRSGDRVNGVRTGISSNQAHREGFEPPNRQIRSHVLAIPTRPCLPSVSASLLVNGRVADPGSDSLSLPVTRGMVAMWSQFRAAAARPGVWSPYPVAQPLRAHRHREPLGRQASQVQFHGAMEPDPFTYRLTEHGRVLVNGGIRFVVTVAGSLAAHRPSTSYRDRW